MWAAEVISFSLKQNKRTFFINANDSLFFSAKFLRNMCTHIEAKFPVIAPRGRMKDQNPTSCSKNSRVPSGPVIFKVAVSPSIDR